MRKAPRILREPLGRRGGPCYPFLPLIARGGAPETPQRRTGSEPSAMTPPALLKATAGLLGLASTAAGDLGAAAVVLLPEGAMDWEAVREACRVERLIVATPSER